MVSAYIASHPRNFSNSVSCTHAEGLECLGEGWGKKPAFSLSSEEGCHQTLLRECCAWGGYALSERELSHQFWKPCPVARGISSSERACV